MESICIYVLGSCFIIVYFSLLETFLNMYYWFTLNRVNMFRSSCGLSVNTLGSVVVECLLFDVLVQFRKLWYVVGEY